MVSLDEAADNLHSVRLAYQLGGPVGTLEPLKLDLGLDAPLIPWHTLRGRVGELAGALGVACGAIGKAARDVTLMPEVRERVGGGSTSMPHKHNPVAAISALGCALQAPGLVATLLAAMVQEHERAAGAWHSEWAPLNQLLVTTGSAASWLRTCLETLEVHPATRRRRHRRRRTSRRPRPGGPMIPHHLISGPEDAPPLVLSNSLGATLAMWDPQHDALAKQLPA